MPSLNGKEIKLYNFDTDKTIKNRIAGELKTLPDFLYVDKVTDATGEINYINLIEQVNKNDITFTEFYNKFKKYYPDLTLEDFAKVYMDYNETIKEDSLLLFDVELQITDIAGKEKVIVDINRLKGEQSDRLRDTQRKIDENISDVKNLVATSEKFIKTKSMSYTPFVTEKVLISYETNIQKSLLDIFNSIQCNEKVVYTNHKQFIKVHSDFKIPPFWMVHLNEYLLIKVLLDDTIKMDMNENTYDISFADVLFYEENNILKMGIKVYIRGKDIKQIENRVISYIENALLFDFAIRTRMIDSITGYFLLPNLKINKYVFADLVMLNKFYKNYLLIDESNKASKKKDAIYFSFNDPSIPDSESGLSITSKKTARNDPDLKSQDKILFLEFKYFTKVKVLRASNLDMVNRIQDILSKLLTIYKEDEENIIEEYRKYIPGFAQQEEEEEAESPKKSLKRLKLKDIAPDLFLDKYTRSCDKKPTIIDDEEVEEYLENGLQVMKFPKDADALEKGQKQYNYVCNYDDYPYPGLRLNNLSNSAEYKYLPCCYGVDHKTKKKSYYREYFYGETLEEKGEQQRIISTNKVVELDKYGYLPENLGNMFNTIDNEYEYLRKGSSLTTSSFLECVLDVVDKNISGLKGSSKVNYVEKKRKELLDVLTMSFRNDPFNYENLGKVLENMDAYLDPRMFLYAIMYKYKVNIKMFTRKYKELEAQPLVQNYKYFIQNCIENYDKTLFIYEHWGNESDKMTYPVCELIIKLKPETQKTTFYFNSTEIVSRQVDILFDKYTSFYTTNNLLIKNIPEFPFEITKTIYDNEGFMRIFVTRFEDKDIFVYCDPMPDCSPHPSVENREFTAFDVVSRFIIQYNLPIVSFSRYMENGTINVLINNKECNILTQNIPPVYPYKQVSYLYGEKHKMDMYKAYKKSGYILQEYILYAFSTFVNNNKDLLTDEGIERFFREKTEKIDYDYSLLSDKFDLENLLYNNGGVIPIFNDKVENKLKYELNRLINFDRMNVLTYMNRVYMSKYYSETTDFKQYQNNDIYDSFYTYNRIISMKNDFKLHRHIIPEKIIPYYLKLRDTYLVIPAVNKKEALSVSYNYFREKRINRNIIDYEGGYTMFVYNSNLDIKFYRQEGENANSVLILVYKHKKEMKYVSLVKVI